MKKLICALFVVSIAALVSAVEPTFKENGKVISGKKTVTIDKLGVTKLKVTDQVKLKFDAHIHLDNIYVTPDKMFHFKRSINQRYKSITFNSDYPEIKLSYMNELILQESGNIKLKTLFAIPTGYKLKYAVLKILVIPQDAAAPVVISSDSNKVELPKDPDQEFKRFFSNIKQLTFYPDNPELRFSLKTNTPFLIQRENGIYFIQLSVAKPCEMEIGLK